MMGCRSDGRTEPCKRVAIQQRRGSDKVRLKVKLVVFGGCWWCRFCRRSDELRLKVEAIIVRGRYNRRRFGRSQRRWHYFHACAWRRQIVGVCGQRGRLRGWRREGVVGPLGRRVAGRRCNELRLKVDLVVAVRRLDTCEDLTHRVAGRLVGRTAGEYMWLRGRRRRSERPARHQERQRGLRVDHRRRGSKLGLKVKVVIRQGRHRLLIGGPRRGWLGSRQWRRASLDHSRRRSGLWESCWLHRENVDRV
jgi:hypothetical protein